MRYRMKYVRWALGLLATAALTGGESMAQTASCTSASRTVRADVVALDQVITYNRFGSYNPVGMIYALKEDVVASTGATPGPGNASLRPTKRPRPLVLRANVGDCLQVTFYNWLASTPPSADAPSERRASMHVNGMVFDPIGSDGGFAGSNPDTTIAPGNTPITYSWYAEKEGSYLVYSEGALAGGEGDGGSLVHGLFGAVVVEPANSVWYRSQLMNADLELIRTQIAPGPPPVYQLDYTKTYSGSTKPVAKILDDTNQIRYSEINAIIGNVSQNCSEVPEGASCGDFREFVTIFHDELKTIHPFCVLNSPGEGPGPSPDDLIPCNDENRKRFHPTRDGFGINYGSAGIGTILLSKMNGMGPAAGCPECVYEEFFLTSWANGDPALLVNYLDDPSNVHHSYLNDPVKFRNLHAGPFETHIFHLHAHQWLHEPTSDNSTYLDSQTIGPGSAFDYDIFYGGGGNRNHTPGDAIFHCHLYPHFAQGMWALWRNHDVFEDGSVGRNLPDGEYAGGTPNPAVVPMPGRAMAPYPTAALPGYPFYMGGAQGAVAGHRPPQAPLDLEFTGGLPRHIVLAGTRTANNLNDPNKMFCQEWLTTQLKLIPNNGTTLEQAAMTFHAQASQATQFPDGTTAGANFVLNGRPAVPGAPFADPCPVTASGPREYRAAAIQINIQANGEGWHDPQARINALDQDVPGLLLSGGTSAGRGNVFSSQAIKAEPFFIRANSNECINFHHTNLQPKDLKEDAFQICVPTDTLGQHIHLVKFDVQASDGSANGWNYEDGTFSNEEVQDLVAANNAWPGSTPLTVVDNPNFPALAGKEALGAQTTAQRWWADPLRNRQGQDRTIRTVFTHDHFNASTIQQHGFYGALVIEPVNPDSGAPTVWNDPVTGAQLGTRSDGGPTRASADIVLGGDGDFDNDGVKDHFREYSLAVADFALLYDKYEVAVNPPGVPEALSSEDPGSMTINYRNDPIPLRISNDGGSTQAGGRKGDMANVFSSCVHGRDPWTPLLMAYEGDPVKFRLIQGAQEEQHAFAINGFRWPFEASEPLSGYKNAQAIGISEHFEFVAKSPYACPPSRRISDGEMDRLAWETREDLMGPSAADLGEAAGTVPVDPGRVEVKKALNARLDGEYYPDGIPTKQSKADDAVDRIYDDPFLSALLENGDDPDPYENAKPGSPEDKYTERRRRRQCFSDYMYGSQPIDDLWNGTWGILRVYRDCHNQLRPLPGSFCSTQPLAGYQNPVASGYACMTPDPAEPDACTGATSTRNVNVTAFAQSLTYNVRDSINDPTGLMFALDGDVAAIQAGTMAAEPLVIRGLPGECLNVRLRNRLPRNIPDRSDDARFPGITTLNADSIRPSNRASLHAQLVDYNVRNSDGTAVGFNPDQTVFRNQNRTYRWFVPTILSAPRDPGSLPVAGPESLGAANLRDFGDVMKHGSQGLIAGLVLEPSGYDAAQLPARGTKALITAVVGGGKTDFRELVLFYQDGLNLRNGRRTGNPCIIDNRVFAENPLGPCRQADPEDQGNRAWNYRTEPFWSRIAACGNDPACWLNDKQQYDVFQGYLGTPETPNMSAQQGEAVRIRILQPDGRARQHAYTLSGHTWRNEPSFPSSMTLGAVGGLSVMIHKDVVLNYGAGSKDGNPGDYLMRDMGATQLEGGMWGVFSVTRTKPAQTDPQGGMGAP